MRAKEGKKGPPPAPPNLKVLKAASTWKLYRSCARIPAGLGVQCNFCHVQGNFPSDDNPKKEIARHMIQMVQAINANFKDGKTHVTCYTCHRGEKEPKTAPEPR